MHIETANLIITKFRPEMAESVHLLSLDDDNRRFVPDEVFETIKAAEKTLDAIISFYGNLKKPQIYAILLKNACHIGHVQAIPIKNGWEIGYHIGKQYTKNGYATEAVRAFVPEIMKILGIDELFGICHEENIASRRVLEKCGFIQHEQNEKVQRGKCLYAILR